MNGAAMLVVRARLRWRQRLLPLLMLCAWAAGAVDSQFPGERLGRPLRVHVARGLWWQMLRLHEAIGSLGGAQLTSSVDVYGSPNGYHGSATALGTFPRSPEDLAAHDVIVLAGCRVAALSPTAQEALAAWVRRGGGLLITGGPMSLDCETYGPMADILPVELTPQPALRQLQGAPLGAATGTDWAHLAWAAKPRIYWLHAGLSPRPGSRTLLVAEDIPVLVLGQAGRGRVAVFGGTVCGGPAAGETPFWAWPDWPVLLAGILREISPKDDVQLPPIPDDPAIQQAMDRLQELGNDALGGLLDDENLGVETDDTGAELAELAKLTNNPAFAQAVVAAVAAGNASLTIGQAETIVHATEPFLSPATAQKAGGELLTAGDPGRMILGLRLAGIGRHHPAGPLMARILGDGRGALPRQGEGGMGTGMTAPDGTDEALRLAAAKALADLGDPRFLAVTREAVAQCRATDSATPELSTRRAEAIEMGLAALAVMGDQEAAAELIDRLIANGLAREAAIDLSEHRGTNPSPQVLRERQRAAEYADNLFRRIEQLREAAGRLPPAAWPGVAAQAHTWDGEFATEALLVALSVRHSPELPKAERAALTTIAERTPSAAIRRLCRARLQVEIEASAN